MNRQTILFVIVIVALGAVGYFWYFRSGGSPVPAPQAANPTDRLAADIAGISQLKITQIDASLLQNPLFNALQTAPQVPEPDLPAGRANPFLSF